MTFQNRYRLYIGLVSIQISILAIILICTSFKAASQPTLHTICPGASISFSTPDTPLKSYQWQIMKMDANAFSDLTNDAIFSGVNTNTLNVAGITTSFYGSVFRCLVTDATVISYCDTNYIRFSNAWTGQADNNWNNPNNWTCPVIPDNYTDVYINTGNPVISSNAFSRSVLIKSPATLNVINGSVLNIAKKGGKETVLNSNVKVIDSTLFVLNLDSVLIKQGVYEFSYSGTSPYIEVNDVIVGTQDKGYARKVVSVEKQTGKMIVHTEQAGLLDIFKTADLNFTISTDKDVIPLQKGSSFAKPVESANYGFEFNSYTLRNAIDGSFDIKVGKADIDGDFVLDWKIDSSKIKYFELSCLNFKFDVESLINYKIKANRAWPQLSASVDIFKKPYLFFVPLPFPPFRIPVYIEFSLELVASTEVKSETLEIDSDIDLKSYNNISLGLVYENNAWKTINEKKFTSSINSKNNYLKRGVEIEFGLGAEIAFRFYKIVGPYFSSSVTSSLKSNSYESPGVNLWDFSTALSLTNKVGINAEIASGPMQVEFADYSKSWKYLEQTYRTPFKVVSLQTGELSGVPGSFIATPISVAVLDTLGLPEANVQVFFKVTSGGGALESTSAFTNSDGIASTRWKLGTTVIEPQTMEAEARIANNTVLSGAPVKFTALFPQPYSISIIGGDEQLGQTNQMLPIPLEVLVKDKDGGPMAGVKIDWSVTSGSGMITESITFTDINGKSTNTWQMGSTGQQLVKVIVKNANAVEINGSPATFIADLPGMMTVVAGGNNRGNALNQLNRPEGIFVDSTGNVFVADTYNSRIMRWTKGAASGEMIIGPGTLQYNIGIGQVNSVYVLKDSLFFSRKGEYNPSVFKTNLPVQQPINYLSLRTVVKGYYTKSLTVDNEGQVYAADEYEHTIKKYQYSVQTATTENNLGIIVAGGNGGGASGNQLKMPQDVWVDAKSNIYIADGLNARIQKWAPGASSGVTVAGGNSFGSNTNQFNCAGVCVDSIGNIYVADRDNVRILKFPASSNSGTNGSIIAGGIGGGYPGVGSALNQFALPTDLFIRGKYLYIVDADNDRVMRLRL